MDHLGGVLAKSWVMKGNKYGCVHPAGKKFPNRQETLSTTDFPFGCGLN